MLLVHLLTACSGGADKPESGSDNQPPGAPIVAIVPADPRTDDELSVILQGQAVDPDGDPVSYAYAWFRDDAPEPDTGETIAAASTARGETWKVVVTPNDGELDGAPAQASVTIGNTAPSATVTIAPASPTTLDDVVATAVPTDPDGDSVSLTWRWTRDGEDAGLDEAALPAGIARRDEVWVVTATPSDDAEAGEPATASFVVADLPPTLPGVVLSPDPAHVGDLLTATVAPPEDPDGDPVTVTYTWRVDGVVQQAGAEPTFVAPVRGSTVEVEAVPSDGTLDGAAVVAALTVANAAPSATGARVTPDPLYADSVPACVGAGWSDPDGDGEAYAVRWFVNGVEAAVPPLRRGDAVSCELTPDDGTSQGAPVTSAVVVVANSAPACAAASVTIGPDPATVSDTIAVATDGYVGCADADGDALTELYDWQVDGVSVATSTALAPGSAPRGSSVVLVTAWTDGLETGATATSNTVTVVNRPPVATVTLSPDPLLATALASAVVSTTDLDGDAVSVGYAWTLDGAAAGTDPTLGGLRRGQAVAVTVTPHDGYEAGAPVTSTATVANSPPSAPGVSITPGTPGAGDTLLCLASAAEDADGDTLTYTFAWSVGGIPYGGATTTLFPGDTVPGSVTSVGQVWTCTVAVTDGFDTSEAGLSVEVGCDDDGDSVPAASCGGDDCDDADAAIHPGAVETCDGVDNDCDAAIDDADDSLVATVYYPDADGDTYGDATGGVPACTRPAGWLTNGDDCNDADRFIRPGATERCDPEDDDEDCDGLAEDADASVSGQTSQYLDADGDGWADSAATVLRSCDLHEGYVTARGDCDDAEATVNPGAEEVCADGVDNDCDGAADPCGLYGSTVASAWSDALVTSDFGWTLDAGDFDADGQDDLVVGDPRGKRVSVWFGPLGMGDAGAADALLTVPSSWFELGNVLASAGDMDGDGDDEILVAGWDYSYYSNINAWIVEGDPAFTSVDVSRLAWVGAGSDNDQALGSAGDMDGDGLADVLLGRMGPWGYSDTDQYLDVYYGDPSGTYTSVTYTVAAYGFGDKGSAVKLGDTDGDGLDDLLLRSVNFVTSADTESRMYLVPGDSTPASDRLTSGDAWFEHPEWTYPCAPGDIDEDGLADVGIAYGDVYLFTSPVAASSTTASAYATVDTSSAVTCRFGDSDADGHQEGVFAGDSNVVYDYPLAPGAHADPRATLAVSSVDAAAFAELTGDGYDDVVLGGYEAYIVSIFTGGEW